MAAQISVVLPVFNGGATLRRAIDSIRAQTHQEWELVAVDDGSVDDTPAILDACARTDDRIRVLTQSHAGIVAALNRGIAASRTPYIARMDADDESIPSRLALQLAFLEARPDLGLTGCQVAFAGDAERQRGYALHVEWLNTLVEAEAIVANRFVESPFAHPSVMFRKELVVRHGGYREGNFPEDYELWLRWMDEGVRMAKVPSVLLRWHDHASRLSRTHAAYAPDAFFSIKAGYIARELARVSRDRAIYVWGAGRPTRKRANLLQDHGVTIAGYIDIDPKKTGRSVGGRPVLGPTDIPRPSDALVLGYVSSRGARELIRAHLQSAGYVECQDFLMCA